MKFGMPYMGSKNSIAAWIVNQLPPARHFYDVFGGGGAITHAAVLSGKYRHVHYNELNPLVCKGFEMAINGGFKDETRWISREDFFRLWNTDPYAAICFSFGNNLRDYIYGKDIEPTYREITDGAWLDDSPYGVVHRIAADGSEKGIGAFCINWVFDQCGHIRIDTHGDNKAMQRLMTKLGFIHCGTIYVEEDDYPRLAFEKISC